MILSESLVLPYEPISNVMGEQNMIQVYTRRETKLCE